MHAEYASRGENLPAVFPAGPDNPMGLYALYIGRLYAIHGTNANFGIGLRVSHGCVRLRADDIKWLFDHVPVGTRVQFINQPVKASVEPDGSRWMEVHNPLSTTEEQFNSRELVPITLTQAVGKVLVDGSVNQSQVDKAIQNRSGMPVQVNAPENSVAPAPVPFNEGEDAEPKEEPMTPVMSQPANPVAVQSEPAPQQAQPVQPSQPQPEQPQQSQPAQPQPAQ